MNFDVIIDKGVKIASDETSSFRFCSKVILGLGLGEVANKNCVFFATLFDYFDAVSGKNPSHISNTKLVIFFFNLILFATPDSLIRWSLKNHFFVYRILWSASFGRKLSFKLQNENFCNGKLTFSIFCKNIAELKKTTLNQNIIFRFINFSTMNIHMSCLQKCIKFYI